MTALDLASGTFLETVTISMVGKDRQTLQHFIKDCMDVAFLREEGMTIIWSGSCGSWR